MVVDYSKWDKLELSDDSDVEVHPNVDKKSFIRWKQRDIHEKREQTKFRLAQLEVNQETNEDLLKRVDKLITAGEAGHKVGVDVSGDVALTARGESKEKPAKATSPQQPKYDDMIESMLMQIVTEGNDPAIVLGKLREHREMIVGALADEAAELNRLREERKQHITADDIHTGWDSTIVYSSKAGESPSQVANTSTPASTPASSTSVSSSSASSSVRAPAQPSGTAKSTSVETLNTPRQHPVPRKNEDGLEELLPATREFGEIKKGDMQEAYKFLMQHPYIVTEGQKDALTMSAFDFELAGDTKMTEQVVWNALLIQYSAVLGKDGVRLFFSKIVQKDHPARAAFEKDVDTTYNHIRGRCKILSEEYENEEAGKETIQLHAVDPDTELVIGVPPEGSDGRAIYDSFTPAVKEAIDSRDLAKINDVLAAMEIDDAEELVGKLGESGVLQVEPKIYDEAEWKDKKVELEDEMREQDAQRALQEQQEHQQPTQQTEASPASSDQPTSSIDDVD